MPRRTRQDPPSTRADRRSRAQEPESTEESPLSDPQEIVFLPRREGHEWHASEVDREIRTTADLLASDDSDKGKRAWKIGDHLTELYNGFPERVKGEKSFVVLVKKEFGLERGELYEFLKIRQRVKSEERAGKLGRGRMTVGFRLLKQLKITTFEALAKRDLPLPDGETCRFPATVPKLRAALRLLKKGDTMTGTPASRDLVSLAARQNEGLKLARPEDPDLEGVKGRFVARDGRVFFDGPPLATDQLLALARFLRKFDDQA